MFLRNLVPARNRVFLRNRLPLRNLAIALAAAAATATATILVPLPVPTLLASGDAPPPLAFSMDYAGTSQAMAASGYGELAAGRRFLAFDPAGDGRAVEVIGDLATARRVVIVVPGNDTTLRDFDRGLGGVARRAPAVQARAVHDAVQSASPGAPVAVIAWLGYDPPEGLGVAAVREERAAAGALELQHFLAVLPAGARVAVIGHSYGSTVVGLAAHGFGPQVTDVVALGSPGMGVSSVRALGTSARVWAATAEGDWIRSVPHARLAGFGHGTDPTDADFGARILATDRVSNHDSYLTPGSGTLAALVPVILGET